MSKSTEDRIRELEATVRSQRAELEETDARATRANVRARDAEDSYRKAQLDLVTAKDEAKAARDEVQTMARKIAALEADAPLHQKGSSRPPEGPEGQRALERAVKRIADLREMLAHAASELSQLHADEVALSAKRARVLRDACALIARAVGETGEAPPPIPSAALEARLTVHPVVDISEVAELLESLRPPAAAPKVD